MGILDDAKDKLGDAAGWVKDRAEQLGDQAQDAGQSIGEKAADAKHWVESRVGSGDVDDKATFERTDAAEGFTGGGGEFGSADASADAVADAPVDDGVAGDQPV